MLLSQSGHKNDENLIFHFHPELSILMYGDIAFIYLKSDAAKKYLLTPAKPRPSLPAFALSMLF